MLLPDQLEKYFLQSQRSDDAFSGVETRSVGQLDPCRPSVLHNDPANIANRPGLPFSGHHGPPQGVGHDVRAALDQEHHRFGLRHGQENHMTQPGDVIPQTPRDGKLIEIEGPDGRIVKEPLGGVPRRQLAEFADFPGLRRISKPGRRV